MGKLTQGFRIAGLALVAVAGLTLLVFGLPFSGLQAKSVQTSSMQPGIDPGALVVVQRASPQSLKAGDVVTYKSLQQPGQTITHRLVDIKDQSNGPTYYVLKGDANKVADPAVYGDQIIGRVTATVPFVGRALDAIKTPLGLLAFVYLPAALIFISEIRLLVRRLAKIEADKVQRVRQAPVLATEPALPAVAASEQEAIISKPQVVRRRRRVLNGLNVFAAAVIGLLLVAPTVALPSGAATLTGNSISAGTAQPTGQVLIVRVDFPGAPADQVSWQPITYLFNPVRGVTVDMEGWTLESSRGQVFGFRGATPIYPRQRLDVHSGPSGELLVPGDYLALKDASGHIVDAISWGTDSSQLNPAIQGVATGHHVKRTDGAIDTNSVADWVVKQTE